MQLMKYEWPFWLPKSPNLLIQIPKSPWSKILSKSLDSQRFTCLKTVYTIANIAIHEQCLPAAVGNNNTFPWWNETRAKCKLLFFLFLFSNTGFIHTFNSRYLYSKFYTMFFLFFLSSKLMEIPICWILYGSAWKFLAYISNMQHRWTLVKWVILDYKLVQMNHDYASQIKKQIKKISSEDWKSFQIIATDKSDTKNRHPWELGGYYMIPVSRDEIPSHFAGILAVL